MSEALIASLNQRTSDLSAKVAELEAALKGEREKTRSVRKALGIESITDAPDRIRELMTAAKEVDGLKSSIEAAKASAATPDEKDKRIAELQGKIRERDASDAWKAAATKAGVNPALADDLRKLLDVRPPEDGEITPDAFTPLFTDELKAARPWAFASPADSSTTNTAAAAGQSAASGTAPVNGRSGAVPALPALPPGPGVSRGAPETHADPQTAARDRLRSMGVVTADGNLRLA